MESVKGFVIANAGVISVGIILLVIIATICSIFAYITIRKYTSFIRESFATQQSSLESMYTDEQCPLIKSVIDMYNDMLQSKDTKKDHGLTENEINTALTLFQGYYTNLSCEEYLARLARGEIPMKTSSPDQRPEGYKPTIVT